MIIGSDATRLWVFPRSEPTGWTSVRSSTIALLPTVLVLNTYHGFWPSLAIICTNTDQFGMTVGSRASKGAYFAGPGLGLPSSGPPVQLFLAIATTWHWVLVGSFALSMNRLYPKITCYPQLKARWSGLLSRCHLSPKMFSIPCPECSRKCKNLSGLK